ncbi:DNA or RNA helicase of superfamily II [Candidatus Syntrophocurvum alkaliphilum]|uniref:DNA or RNA helicase of superfamily II n=1 Tax=Candidatus Syntrophocurvum alkaliphilum TaxID=2293317 RepID=A0A6I6DHF9_9FIRM|nr:DEAD/DEAH box helicase family protein [Candidatus Syntrophocurvum alkaliphilum]QGT99780.1 DNA or RNA helicase of superfamily II [Candidatus Syntrophocurvum alkaliphilum]
MNLKKGLYEQVINEELNEEIKKNINDVEIYKEIIDYTDANLILTTYLSYIFKKGLNYYKSSKEDVLKQVEIANKIINSFAEYIDDEEFKNYKINENHLLRGVFDKEIINKDIKEIQPITSISKSSLFTGSHVEPTVYSEINKEIATADRVDLLVSFIKYSGLRLIMNSLIEHTKTKKLRVLTTSYMGATDFKAIKMLAELPNTEIRISYDTQRTRLHAKAYYFHRETGFSTAYIGSSNLSKAALTEGTEWNMKISEYTSKEVIEKYRITFETYWNAKDFMTFDINNVNDTKLLKQSLSQETTTDEIRITFDIRPYAYQQEILDKLEVERKVFNSRKNLIVAATGTGKTVVSAFDFKEYYKKNPNCRLLFLAHRKEILQQSIMTFRTILKDQNFGDLWVGEHSPSSDNYLFASIQTLNADSKYKKFNEDYFDFIILDETHHGTADSYDRILNHFKPDILLGLTATPERMDGEDILKYFNNRIAYEVRLHEAIDRGLLCPFHYFGVTDSVDLDSINWVRGKYDISELSNVFTGNDMRANLIIRSLDKYINDIAAVRGLGFCVSKDHAKYMSMYFNKKNILSINLDSDSSLEERNNAQTQLIKGEIKFIFVVDLYNEGIDIPEINTVLFLRPTESSTVFIQQLGRGLRITENKDVLTVLDFVGQANKEFNFRSKLRSVVGKTENSIEEEIENEFPTLPKGCFVQLEKKAKEYILNNIKQTYANKNNLRKMIRNYKHETNKPLTLSNFLNHYQLQPWQIYKTATFFELCHLENLKRNYIECIDKELNSALKRVMAVI